MTSPTGSTPDRRVLVLAHTGRQEARDVAGQFCVALHKAGISLRLLEDEAADLALVLADVQVVAPGPQAAAECEVVVVIGGDGTILRAEAVVGVADAAGRRRWGARAVTTSPLPGPSGNIEYFLWLRQGEPLVGAADIRDEVRRTADLGDAGEKVGP